jgi:hypothetical protein
MSSSVQSSGSRSTKPARSSEVASSLGFAAKLGTVISEAIHQAVIFSVSQRTFHFFQTMTEPQSLDEMNASHSCTPKDSTDTNGKRERRSTYKTDPRNHQGTTDED